MNKKTVLKLLVSLGVTVSLAVLIFFFSPSRAYQILELKSFDLRLSLRRPVKVTAPVVLIDIDDHSLCTVCRWPWPRRYHARLVDTLMDCGARQVVFDVLFLEESEEAPEEDAVFKDSIRRSDNTYMAFYFPEEAQAPSPNLEDLLMEDVTLTAEDVAEELGVDPGSLRENMPPAKRYVIDRVVRGILRDRFDISYEQLIQILEEENGWLLFPAEEAYVKESFAQEKLARFFVEKFGMPETEESEIGLIERNDIAVPIKDFISVIKGSGFINADSDVDGVTRRVPLFIKYEDKVFPYLALSALMGFLDVKDIETSPGRVVLKDALVQSDTREDILIPVDDKGRIIVNWAGQWGEVFQHVPCHFILQLQDVRDQISHFIEAGRGKTLLPSETANINYLKDSEKSLKEKLSVLVKGKICIVGLTATGTHDIRPVPLQTNYPMVGLGANLIHTIISEKFITKVHPSVNAVIFFLTALIIGIGSLLKLSRSLILTVCFILVYFLISLAFLNFMGIWIDLVGPLGIVVFGFSGITSFRFFAEEKEKIWIKHAFSHYLSSEVINELQDDPSKLKLGGERRALTMLFADVRGFTKFSEAHEPEEVVGMLNEFLTEMVNVIFQHHGTLDKFVGDEIVTFFGAPGEIHRHDHAVVAVRTAVEMQAMMKELQKKWEDEGKVPLRMGIGVNTGDVVVGNMGSSRRMDYTVIGDNVNLAARLCSAAGGDEIIISETTYLPVKDIAEVEKLEPISVKGKSKPIPIYRVIGIK